MNSEYLFTKLTGKNKGELLDADSVYSMLKRLSKKTDINSHPHQLRHYFAEERRKEGWDLNDIRFALGHKKVETTIKYLGENNERLIEATDQYYSNNEDICWIISICVSCSGAANAVFKIVPKLYQEKIPEKLKEESQIFIIG